MKSLTIALTEGETALILESLVSEEARLKEFCIIATNEDAVADYANDLTLLTLVLKRFKDQAVFVFGESILNFSREKL